MARPRGLKLSRPAYLDLTKAMRLSMSEVAAEAGIPLKTLSGLVNGDHRASMKTVRQVTDALRCAPATLFPELLGTPAELVVPDSEPLAS